MILKSNSRKVLMAILMFPVYLVLSFLGFHVGYYFLHTPYIFQLWHPLAWVGIGSSIWFLLWVWPRWGE